MVYLKESRVKPFSTFIPHRIASQFNTYKASSSGPIQITKRSCTTTAVLLFIKFSIEIFFFVLII